MFSGLNASKQTDLCTKWEAIFFCCVHVMFTCLDDCAYGGAAFLGGVLTLANVQVEIIFSFVFDVLRIFFTSVEPRDWSSLVLTCACLLCHSARWAPKDTWPLSCWRRRWTHHSSTPSSVWMSMLLVLWSGRWPGGLVVSQTVSFFCLFFFLSMSTCRACHLEASLRWFTVAAIYSFIFCFQANLLCSSGVWLNEWL